MYDMGCKLLNGTKSMYVNSLTISESECFRIDSGVRQVVSCLLGCSGE